VLEVEVSRDDPAEVSVRFMLCNPPGVDAAFLRLVGELVGTFQMEVYDRESREVNPGWLSLAEFERYHESAMRTIPRRRAEWVARFGPEQFPAGAEEAGRWIICGERPVSRSSLI
jgi:hypothetical protein